MFPWQQHSAIEPQQVPEVWHMEVVPMVVNSRGKKKQHT